MTDKDPLIVPDPRPEVYSVPDLMLVLSVSRQTAYNLIQSGKLRSFTIGRRRMVSRDALLSFIREREAAAAESQGAA